MEFKNLYDVTDPTGDALKASSFARHIYTKRIRNISDLGVWKRSRAYYDLVQYINNTSMAIQGYRQSKGYAVTSQMRKLCKIFRWLDLLLYEFHPMGVGQGLMRCVGTKPVDAMESSNSLRSKCHHAYRRWMLQVQEKIYAILEQQVYPHCKHINELAQYLTRSFGSLRNYEYGPGNELMFLFFLCALFKAGILGTDDTVAAALLLYQRYLDLVRHIMRFYRLSEPHGHGANIVDERNVLPYLWGCAQLCRDAPFTPSQWDQPAVLEKHRKDYMLLSSLEFLQKIMEGESLGVHSYQLWCVLSLSNWPDAYSGLIRTYLKNVLNDFYITQDLIFSEIMSFTRQPLELLQNAYLGKLPQPDSAPSSRRSSRKSYEDELEQDNKEAGLKPKSEQPVEKKSLRFSILDDPPVRRHSSLETDVFLGFQNPFVQHEEDLDERNKHPIVRQRGFHRNNVLVAKLPSEKTIDKELNYDSGESTMDNRKLKILLQLGPSATNSTASYYSM